MSEVEDAASRQLKRHRIDLGLHVPRSSELTTVNSLASINGVFQENVENNSEVLRNLLNLNHNNRANSPIWRKITDSCNSYRQLKLKETRTNSGPESEFDQEIEQTAEVTSSCKQQDSDLECADIPSDSGHSPAMPTAQTAKWEECNGSTSPMQEPIPDSLKAKRARVENIITSMRHSPPTVSASDQGAMDDSLRKPKRKQYQPQPQRWDSGDEDSPGKPSRKEEKTKLKGILSHLQTQLDTLQEKYLTMFDEDDGNISDNSDDMDDLNEPIDTSSAIQKYEKYEMNGVSGNNSPNRGCSDRKRRAEESHILDSKTSLIVRQTLKEELPPLLLNAVDSVMNKLTKSASKNTSNNNSTHAKTEINNQSRNSVLAQHASPPPPAIECKPFLPPPPLFHPNYLMRPFTINMEQTEAMPLVVPSRKRVRSHDRSLPGGALPGAFLPGDLPMKPEPLVPISLPTSVAIPNPSLHQTLAASFMSPPMMDPREHFENLR